MDNLRQRALDIVVQRDPNLKASMASALDLRMGVGRDLAFDDPGGLPGRLDRPELLAHTKMKQRSINTLEGRANLIHSLAHIELNAVNLAADIAWRFADMPDEFYRDWLKVCMEEASHYCLLRDHLRGLGFDYGHFPAHQSLWEMADRTRHDLLARLAIVPRTLEARGLDASPLVKAKLLKVGDAAGAAIIDIILRDEVGHVAVGNLWYRRLCAARGLDPFHTYIEMAATYQAPRQSGPFNVPARLDAGFTTEEIQWLESEAMRSKHGSAV